MRGAFAEGGWHARNFLGSGSSRDRSCGDAGGLRGREWDIADESIDAVSGEGTAPGVADASSASPDEEGINATGQGAGTGAATGLPCDVQQVLENRCVSCHRGTPAIKLLTYEDLVGPSSEAGKNLAQKALERMKSTTSPMPPAPAELPTAQEIGVLENWVTAGTPRGMACTPAGDAGAPAATNPYDTPLKCTSNQTWNQGNEGSSRMHPAPPNGDCNGCHTVDGTKDAPGRIMAP